MDENLRQTVAQNIMVAFSDTPYPGDNNIGGDDPFDGVIVAEAFRGKHWRDITLELLLSHHDKLPFLSKHGYHFYLPAYLLGVLFHFEELDMYGTSSQLISTLVPPSEYGGWFLERLKLFTPQQRSAIYNFLHNYKALFPEESWSYDSDEETNLVNGIEFWKNVIEQDQR